ncbi:MAG: dihydrodipicolinate synthase family protein [Ilumatobacteraceae bacterium]|nr:dihydrodipicolinate synthase family protein [Ilumatobacteraceae bacterium]
MTTPEMRGVLPVLQMPFDDNDQADVAVLRDEIDWLFDHGVDGVVTGMVSEVLRMTADERDDLTPVICKAAAGRGAVVISVGAEATSAAVRHARVAADAGATGLMVAPPMLTRLDRTGLTGYFTAVAEAVSIPIVVQDASGYVGAALPIDVQAQLFRDLGDRVMFKPEAPPIGPLLSQLLAATGGKARIFEGTGGLHLIDSFRRGAVGTMPGSDVAWALVDLWAALQRSDHARAYRIAGPLALLIALQTSLDSYVFVEKTLLVAQGVFRSSRMRGPAGHAADQHTVDEAIRLMALLRDEVEQPIVVDDTRD